MTDPVAAAARAGDRIETLEATGLNAVLHYDRDTLLEAARTAAERGPGSLHGMPVAVKDNICTVRYRTTCGSRLLRDYRSPYDATVIERLERAGGVVAGKTNLDEFGMGSSTEHSAFGRCRHPIDPDRVPGGSSGGSAALVAAGAVPAAIGSETGGSVRQPAAFCGVVGFKPTYGRISRYGLVAFASSLDQVGVFGRDVRTAAMVAAAISGPDPRDATSRPDPPIAPSLDRDALDGVVIGVPREYLPDGLHAGVRRAFDRAVRALRRAGATVRDISLPHADLAVPCYYVIAPAEASLNLARFDGVRYGARIEAADVRELMRASRGDGLGPEVRRRILLGTYVLSSGYADRYYHQALRARRRIAGDFDAAFEDGVDILFTPTTPTPAFRAGTHEDDPLGMYLTDVFTCAANLAGLPAVSIPVGRSSGLPVGAQCIGRTGGDEHVFDVAHVAASVVDAAGEVD